MKNMKIGKKLFVAFLAIIIGLGAIAGYGLFSIGSLNAADQNMYNDNLLGVSRINDITVAFYDLRLSVMKAVYMNSTQDIAGALEKALATADEKLQKGFVDYQDTVVGQEDQNQFDQLKQLYADYTAEAYQFTDMLSSGELSAQQITDEINALGALGAKVAEHIGAVTQYNQDIANKTVEANQSLGMTSIFLLIALAAAAAAISILISVFVTRGITRPINSLVKLADKVALGDIEVRQELDDLEKFAQKPSGEDHAQVNNEIDILVASLKKVITNIQDNADKLQMIAAGNIDIEANVLSEKDVLGKSMQQTVRTIDNLIFEINTMSQQHDLGDIDVVIPAEKFEGAYQVMAEGINTMVQGHIAVKKKAMACISEFGRGNFDAPLERFPGKKAFINDIIEQVRSNLKALITDANMLVESALEGNLSARADVVHHEGDFRKIIQGVNDTLDAVVEPVREAAAVLKEMSAKNFRTYVSGNYKGDHAEIKNAINYTLDSMNKILNEIKQAAEQVAAGSMQVSAGNQAVSQGATEQASSIEELTVTISNIAEKTRQNVTNANESKASATRSKELAEGANEKMKEMLHSMEEINESSENISKIIRVIDDIAFQTNILALNAAVEAARAGVHGKGFAVVAEEVRSLAERSAHAAKETAEMIEGSVKRVGEGTKLADKTAEALDLIVQGALNAEVLEEQIVLASGDQAERIRQVNQGIDELSKVVQTNSATAQQSAAASQELSGQAELLKERISQFKIKEDADGGVAQELLYYQTAAAGDVKY